MASVGGNITELNDDWKQFIDIRPSSKSHIVLIGFLERCVMNIDYIFKFYKVTRVFPIRRVMKMWDGGSIKIKSYTVYNIQLNNYIEIEGVYPNSRFPHGKSNPGRDGGLAYFENKYQSLEKLEGKFIYASVNKYKGRLRTISTDVIGDFKELLDEANGQSFIIPFPMYHFFKTMGRPVNSDNSITLRKEYSKYNINADNLCYPNTITGIMDSINQTFDEAKGRAFQFDFPIYSLLKKMNYPVNKDDSMTLKNEYSEYNINADNFCYPNTNRSNTLTFENIGIIFDNFFRGKKKEEHPNSDYDYSEYYRNDYAIYIDHISYKKRFSGDRSQMRVLAIGDDLEKKHIRFLAENLSKEEHIQKSSEIVSEDEKSYEPKNVGLNIESSREDMRKKSAYDRNDDRLDVTDWALTDDEKEACKGWAIGTPLGGW